VPAGDEDDEGESEMVFLESGMVEEGGAKALTVTPPLVQAAVRAMAPRGVNLVMMMMMICLMIILFCRVINLRAAAECSLLSSASCLRFNPLLFAHQTLWLHLH